jgi:hypothetical protein
MLPTLHLHYVAALHLLPPRCYLYRRLHHRNASPSHHDLRNAGPLFQGLSKRCTAATTTATTAIPTTTTTSIYAPTIPTAAAAGGEAFGR